MKIHGMKIQRRVFITGQVQGVGFRSATLKEARKYPALQGYVRNLKDGRVEVLFAGEENEVLALVAWCKQGPSSARVYEIEVIEEAYCPSKLTFEAGLTFEVTFSGH
jgi:acylphosphatase